jgi:hypothetical protein
MYTRQLYDYTNSFYVVCAISKLHHHNNTILEAVTATKVIQSSKVISQISCEQTYNVPRPSLLPLLGNDATRFPDDGETEKISLNRIEYRRADTTVTRALRPLSMFCATL